MWRTDTDGMNAGYRHDKNNDGVITIDEISLE